MPTSPSSIPKQPWEEFPVDIDFKKQMETSEEITAKAVTAMNGSTDVTEDIIAGSIIASDKQTITIGIKGGSDGDEINISTKVTTDRALPDATFSKYESDVMLIVLEEPAST